MAGLGYALYDELVQVESNGCYVLIECTTKEIQNKTDIH
jgi:hypothetical protein